MVSSFDFFVAAVTSRLFPNGAVEVLEHSENDMSDAVPMRSSYTASPMHKPSHNVPLERALKYEDAVKAVSSFLSRMIYPRIFPICINYNQRALEERDFIFKCQISWLKLLPPRLVGVDEHLNSTDCMTLIRT